MNIYGLNKTTLLDYPGRPACTVFTGNCNFRCIYCHNYSLVLNPPKEALIPEEEIFAFLKKRRGILQGVCITGGEPTVNPGLKDFIIRVKELGYPVKLDSNGYRPEIIRELTDEGLLDMIAMDIKTDRERYPLLTGLGSFDLSKLDAVPKSMWSDFVKLLSPYAPHLGEELWNKLGNTKSIAYESWPTFCDEFLKDDSKTIVVMVNGKKRDTFEAAPGSSQEDLKAAALARDGVKKFTDGHEIAKCIIVPDKLVNIVVK